MAEMFNLEVPLKKLPQVSHNRSKILLMKYALIFITLLFFGSIANCQNDYSQTPMLKGKVVEQKSLLPVRKAKITVRNIDSNVVVYNTRTDDNGEFYFPISNIRNFSIDVEKFLYEGFSKQFNLAELGRLKAYALPDILLKSSIEYNPPAKDTTPLSPREFLANSVYKFDILPTPSCYELYYDLNPGLREMKLVPPGTEIIRPKTPEFTRQEKSSYKALLNIESEKDRTAQQALKDSIAVLNSLYEDYLTIVKMNYNETSRDTIRMLLKIIHTDVNDYEKDIKSLSKAKAVQLTNLVLVTNMLLRETGTTLEISPSNYEELIALARDISIVVESNYFQQYFYGSEDKAFSKNTPLFYHTKFVEAESKNKTETLSSDVRIFKVSVHLQKNGRVISSGPEVEQKFLVSFFPGALKNIKALYRNCQPLATYGGITLLQGIYQHAVYDSETGKEMTIIGSPLFDSSPAFKTFAKSIFGGANISEIQIYVK